MTIIGSAYVDIRAITDKLEADIKTALASLPETIDIKVEADTRPAEEQIDLLVAWAEEHTINIDVDANTSAAEVHIGEIVDEEPELTIDVDADTAAATAHVQDFMAAAEDHEINVPVDVDDIVARVGLMALMGEWGHRVLDWGVNVHAAAASVQLAILSRPRFVDIFPRMHEGTREKLGTAFQNMGTFLAGISGGSSLKGFIDHAIQAKIHIGEMVPAISAAAIGIGGLATAAIAAGGGLLSLGASVASLVGVVSVAPAAFVSLSIAMKITTLAFGDMKKAVPDLYAEMKTLKEGISHGFWDEARSGFEDLFVRSSVLKDSLVETSHAVGGFWGAMFAGMAKDDWAKAMQGDFAKLNEGIKIMTDSSGVFLNIFKTLGEFGTTYVPKMAQGFVDMSTKFDAFLSRSQADGSLKRWVDNGIQGFKDLGKVIGELSGVFGGLAEAATKAGGASLGSMAEGLEKLNDAIHKEDFQKNLVNIFEGSYAAMQHVKSGLSDIFGAIGYLSPSLKIVETSIGSTIESLLKGIAKVFARPEVAKGLEDLFSGIHDGVENLMVMIDPLGNKLGSVMSFVGELARNLGDVMGHAGAVLLPPIEKMLETIQPLIAPLGTLVKAITDNFAPILDTLANDIIPPLVKELEKILPPITRLTEAITPYVVTLLESFAKSLGAGNVGDGAQKDADGINELAKSLEDGQKPFKDFMDAMNELDKGTSEALKMQPVIDWHNGVVGMWKDMNDGAVGFNKDMRKNADETWGPFNKAVEKMNTDVNKGLDDFWHDVDANNKGFSEDFKKGWDDFWGGLDGFSKDTNKNVNQGLADFWGDVGRNNEGAGKDFMKGWDGMWKDFGKATKPVADTAGKIKTHIDKIWGSLISRPIDNFVKDWNKGWEKLKSDNQKLSGDINKNVSKWWSDLGNDFKKGADNIGKNWDKAWGDLKNGNQKASADINKSVSKWWGDLGNDFNKGAGNIKKNWDKAWGDLKSGNQKISADINKNVSKWWGDISAPFVKKGGEISKNWNKTWDDIKSNNKKLSADINKNISAWWNDLSSDFTRGAKSLGDGWDGMWKDIVRGASEFAADVQKGIDKFWADVQHGWEEGMKVVKDIEERGWDAVFDYLDGLWGDMLAAGGHIIDGLAQGIRDGVSAVGKAIASVGQSVLDGIAHIMEMASPSKAMRKRGQWIVEGLSDGIDAHSDLAVNATHTMSKRILEAARVKIPPIQTSGFSGPTGGNSNIFANLSGSEMPTPQSYGYNGRGTGAPTVVQPTVNVYPSAPLNERQVGQMAASELFWNFTNR